jgi:hypothetical protein
MGRFAVETAVYFPYAWPRQRPLRDILLYFDELEIMEGTDPPPDETDLRYCMDRGIIRTTEPAGVLSREELHEVQQIAERLYGELGRSGFRSSFGGLEPDPSRLPSRDQFVGPSLAELREAWNSDPDLVSLRKEVGLDNDDPDFVVVRKGKFGVRSPALSLLIDGALRARQRGGSTNLSERAKRAERWLEGCGGFLANPELACCMMAALAAQFGRVRGVVPVTDIPSAARMYDSLALGHTVERLDDEVVPAISPLSPLEVAASRQELQLRSRYGTVPFADARSLLYRLSIPVVSLDDKTPINRVVRFREKYSHELHAYHSMIRELIESLQSGLDGRRSLGEHLERSWTSAIAAGLAGLEEARRREGLRSGNDLLVALFYTAAPTAAARPR